MVKRKYLPLNLHFPIQELITEELLNLEEKEILNFAALDSEKYIFFGELNLWNINIKNIENGQTF